MQSLLAHMGLEAAGAYIENGFIWDLILLWQLFVMACIGYTYTDKIRGKTIFLVLAMYHGYIAFTETIYPCSTFISIALEITCLSWLLAYEATRVTELKSSKFNNKNLFFIFYKPRRLHQTLLSLFGYPVSSFGVVTNGIVYQMSNDRREVITRPWQEWEAQNYVVIDTGEPFEQYQAELDQCVGTKARGWSSLCLKLNCLRAFKPLMMKLPKGWRYKGEVLPSWYLARVSRERSLAHKFAPLNVD